MSLAFDDALRDELIRRLHRFERRREPTGDLRQAAVALVIVAGDPPRDSPGEVEVEAAVVLTRRASTLRAHSGQFALPGGSLDPGETAIHAALRELHEEVGLELETDHVLGCLDDHVTRSGYHLTPVVVWGTNAAMTPSPDEVAAIHKVSLSKIAAAETRHLIDLDGRGHSVLALAIVDTLVFAPTASLMLQLGRLAVDGAVERVHHFEQPRFAWS